MKVVRVRCLDRLIKMNAVGGIKMKRVPRSPAKEIVSFSNQNMNCQAMSEEGRCTRCERAARLAVGSKYSMGRRCAFRLSVGFQPGGQEEADCRNTTDQ